MKVDSYDLSGAVLVVAERTLRVNWPIRVWRWGLVLRTPWSWTSWLGVQLFITKHEIWLHLLKQNFSLSWYAFSTSATVRANWWSSR